MTNEEAIKRLENHKRWFQDEFVIYCDAVDALDMAINALKAQLSPEDTTKGTTLRSTGKWEDRYDGTVCSECGEYVFDDGDYHLIWHPKYCPHCGSYNLMVREEKER